MNDMVNRALLPTGLRDMLPPDAAFEADVVHRVMDVFAAHGFDRVKPPLIEFEDSLLADGGGLAAQTFRVMDPLAQRMMGVRPDMTPQIARIATTRLNHAPRPLRLSYAGQVLRVKGSQLRPERQFAQAGLELIGPDVPAADVEAVLVAVEALRALGVADLTVDLGLPRLVPAICQALGVALHGQPGAPKSVPILADALDHKDAAAVAALGGPAAAVLDALLQACGPVETALERLAAIELPEEAARQRDRLSAVVAGIRAVAPDLPVTLDPVENRGFAYHTGITFTMFSRRLGAELGSGGRYLAAGREAAVGATLYMDSVLAALPQPQARRRIYLPAGTDPDAATRLRGQGYVTIAGLEPVADAAAEAHRLGCAELLVAGAPVPVNGRI
jgi:ATP phosphoribosyltransferase regulatory subunit